MRLRHFEMSKIEKNNTYKNGTSPANMLKMHKIYDCNILKISIIADVCKAEEKLFCPKSIAYVPLESKGEMLKVLMHLNKTRGWYGKKKWN